MAKNYAKGAYVKERETNFGTMLDISVNKKQFIEWLGALTANDKGYVNLQAAPQQNDKTKYSVWENNWKPQGSDDSGLPF